MSDQWLVASDQQDHVGTAAPGCPVERKLDLILADCGMNGEGHDFSRAVSGGRLRGLQPLGSSGGGGGDRLPVLFDSHGRYNEPVKATLEAINQMQADGVIGKYAIGGAVAATFYLAPAATVDLDVFVTLPGTAAKALVTLSPIYDFLTARGGKVQDEYIVLDDWPVQFLLPGNALEGEGVDEAISTSVEGVPTRVMSAEHLVAIALNVGRPKDRIRILQFLEQGVVDKTKLKDIVERYGLSAKWKQFEHRFLGGAQ